MIAKSIIIDDNEGPDAEKNDANASRGLSMLGTLMFGEIGPQACASLLAKPMRAIWA